MRFYELVATDGGPLPTGGPVQVGAIIRVPRSNTPKPGAQWNAETACWVAPIWRECADPTERNQA
jgi:hypothetical protein